MRTSTTVKFAPEERYTIGTTSFREKIFCCLLDGCVDGRTVEFAGEADVGAEHGGQGDDCLRRVPAARPNRRLALRS
jgi:hypothetical protein